MITLGDLKEMDEKSIIEHLAKEYTGEQYVRAKESEINEAMEKLKEYSVLVAYESVGDYGCDSSSFFLLKHNETGELYEIHGSHCSCYGFEGQLDLEKTTIEALKHRVNKGNGVFNCGGYDDNGNKNQKIVNEYIKNI